MARQTRTKPRGTGKRRRVKDLEETPSEGEGSNAEMVPGGQDTGDDEAVSTSMQEDECLAAEEMETGPEARPQEEDPEESDDDEGPEQVLLARGKNEALERRRLENDAIKRCGLYETILTTCDVDVYTESNYP